jgi:DNA replication and repair protein RecF
MYLQKLSFRNFRNFAKIDLEVERGLTLLWGNNAQGKTNFLEAIFFLSNLKSFRTAKNTEVIRWGKDCFHLAGEIVLQPVARKVDVGFDKKGKSVRVNGKPVKSGRDYFGAFKTVLFSPDEMNLVKGGPAGRRALLDRAVFLIDPDFLDQVRKYVYFLKNRNLLLKEDHRREELEAWTEGFIQAGVRLRTERLRYLGEFIPALKKNYRDITGTGENVDVLYPDARKEEADLTEKLKADLKKTRKKERDLGYTLVGPHWDDPIFVVDGRPLRVFGSQGQKRSFLMSFKITQVEVVEAKTGKTPVLLLDDMASELDALRQHEFFRFLAGREGQVFMTTTDKDQLSRYGISPRCSLEVSSGTLKEVTYERL